MVEKVTAYKSSDEKVFDNKVDAEKNQAEIDLLAFLDSEWYRGIESKDITLALLENAGFVMRILVKHTDVVMLARI